MGDDWVALVPVMVVLGIAAIPIAAQYFAYRRHKMALNTARELLRADDLPDEAVIRALVRGAAPPKKDLRRGILFLGLAVAGFAFSFVLETSQARITLQAATLFPLILGSAYLAFHWLNRDTVDGD